MSLDGKVVLITEAASGVGAATARRLAPCGCLLALAGGDSEQLKTLGQDCQRLGASDQQILLLAGDLADEENVEEAVKRTIDKFGVLNILVCNLGWECLVRGSDGPISDTPSVSFDGAMLSVVRTVYHLTRVASPHLIQAKGTAVINYGFPAATSSSHRVVYAVCKSSMDFFVRSLAVDLATKGVRINSVIPGEALIERVDEMKEQLPAQSPGTRVQWQSQRARQSHEDKVAAAVAYLASDDASMVTGQLLAIDGGRSILPSAPKN